MQLASSKIGVIATGALRLRDLDIGIVVSCWREVFSGGDTFRASPFSQPNRDRKNNNDRPTSNPTGI
jgi:hypothetical protein